MAKWNFFSNETLYRIKLVALSAAVGAVVMFGVQAAVTHADDNNMVTAAETQSNKTIDSKETENIVVEIQYPDNKAPTSVLTATVLQRISDNSYQVDLNGTPTTIYLNAENGSDINFLAGQQLIIETDINSENFKYRMATGFAPTEAVETAIKRENHGKDCFEHEFGTLFIDGKATDSIQFSVKGALLFPENSVVSVDMTQNGEPKQIVLNTSAEKTEPQKDSADESRTLGATDIDFD